MNDSIYTIPISEVFEPKDGCPICRMRNTLEKRCVEYITGAAMMEPDIRIKTNEKGFCKTHFPMIYAQKNKLSVALILESHLNEVKSEIFEKSYLLNKKGKGVRAGQFQESCFVCDKINWALNRHLETVILMYQRDKDFRALYREQPVICLEHYADLLKVAQKKLKGSLLNDFIKDTDDVVKKYLYPLCEDVTHFTKMFDYRNSGEDADWKNSKDSIQRAIWFLTSRSV